MWEWTKRISFRISSVLSNLEPEPGAEPSHWPTKKSRLPPAPAPQHWSQQTNRQSRVYTTTKNWLPYVYTTTNGLARVYTTNHSPLCSPYRRRLRHRGHPTHHRCPQWSKGWAEIQTISAILWTLSTNPGYVLQKIPQRDIIKNAPNSYCEM